MQIVIPAFNEEARLPHTLATLRAHVLAAAGSVGPVEVIVVDNASTDDTARVARAADSAAMRVSVVSCLRRGKGAAVAAGMAATTADLVAFMDADGATELDALTEAARLIAAGADVAIASRAVTGSVTDERHTRARTLGAAAYRRATRTVAPGIRDTQCGFKVLRGPLGRSLFSQVRATGFSFDVELLGLASRRGARVVEFPVVWHDVPGSTFVPLRHGAATFLELALIAHRLRRRPAPVVELSPADAASRALVLPTVLPAVDA